MTCKLIVLLKLLFWKELFIAWEARTNPSETFCKLSDTLTLSFTYAFLR